MEEKLLGALSDGWFREESEMWPGQAQSLKVKHVLHAGKTKYQDLGVFVNDGPWGTVMTLDGAIQLTEKDEFAYHEMLAHIPLCCHPNPEDVLIIGGGDGGVLREVLKHEGVQHCDLVDIDGAVIEASKRFFPSVSSALGNARATITVGDGAEFVRGKLNAYDVIIVDSSDPAGPASVLFGEAFYRDVHGALRNNGIVCSQGESIWIHMDIIEKMMSFLRHTIQFAEVKYGIVQTPTYPCGSIGCLTFAKRNGTNVYQPTRPIESFPWSSKLQYYDSSVHRAAFVLPRFAASLNTPN